MINFEQDIYILETEIRPNKYARIAIIATLCITGFSLFMNELGLFRVDKTVMRIGSSIAILGMLIPFIYALFKKDVLADPLYKYLNMVAAISFTVSTSILMTFHTTIMLIFPMFLAMLYRSKLLGKIAVFASLFLSLFSALFGYLLGTWDVPLFQELINIATNGTAVIENAHSGVTLLSALKILFYLALPKTLMVGACALLTRYVIQLGSNHVEMQIQLQRQNRVDALTGTYNRNYYKSIIESDRKDGELAVFFFDVNGLKSINDALGHEYGDILLKKCAQSLLIACDGPGASIFRIGGDEFVVLYENCTESKASAFLASWNDALKKINDENVDGYDGIHCSMACGYAIGSFSELQELISKADSQMYMNKTIMKSAKSSLENR